MPRRESHKEAPEHRTQQHFTIPALPRRRFPARKTRPRLSRKKRFPARRTTPPLPKMALPGPRNSTPPLTKPSNLSRTLTRSPRPPTPARAPTELPERGGHHHPHTPQAKGPPPARQPDKTRGQTPPRIAKSGQIARGSLALRLQPAAAKTRPRAAFLARPTHPTGRGGRRTSRCARQARGHRRRRLRR